MPPRFKDGTFFHRLPRTPLSRVTQFTTGPAQESREQSGARRGSVRAQASVLRLFSRDRGRGRGGGRAEPIGESRRPAGPACPLFAVGCHVLAGTYQFISGKNKEDRVSTATSSVLPPESTKRAKASSPCLSASACSLPRVGTARSRQRGRAPRGPSPWSSS